MSRFNEKVVFVTGAARGQGRSHAVRFAQEGADVVAVDFVSEIPSVPYPTARAADLAETATLVASHGRQALTCVVDVRQQTDLDDAVTQALDMFGHIDVVCANAGILSYGPTWNLTEEQWCDVIDVNLTGVFHTIKATVPSMISNAQGGAIIITSSGAGLRGAPNIGHYVASKHGVVGLMRTLAKELVQNRIRVNTVHPSHVGTDMIHNPATYRVFRPDLLDPTVEDILQPMQQSNGVAAPWIEVDDVSNAVLWLASDEARYVTGATIPIAVQV